MVSVKHVVQHLRVNVRGMFEPGVLGEICTEYMPMRALGVDGLSWC